MDALGGGLINLSNNAGNGEPNSISGDDFSPAWSPDGRKLAFVSGRLDPFVNPTFTKPNYEVFVMQTDSSLQANITKNPSNDIDPAWAPSAQKIAFSSDRSGDHEIYIMNPNGSSPTKLTTSPGDDVQPVWSPDGMKIAFTSFRDGNYEIYVMNADGTNPVNLSKDLAFDADPAWSPDGQKLVFTSLRDGDEEIYVMNADGTGQTRLTDNETFDRFPFCSPNGKQIAFATRRDGNFEIYVMNSDGTGQTRLTNNPATDDEPDWQAVSALSSISGRVAKSDGTPFASVTITLSGSQSETATTDANGHYSFANLATNGKYTVTASRANYTFAPPSLIFNNLVGNQTANFTGTLNNYTLSGRVTLPAAGVTGPGLSGVTMTLSGSQSTTASTDANGDYSFTVAAEGNYMVVPSRPGYDFTPPSQSFTHLGSNQRANFTAKPRLGPANNFIVGSSPRSVAVGDFNNDGKPDVAVAIQFSKSVSILLGTGGGSFGPETSFGVGISPVSVAVGDFNNDGKLDLATANSTGANVSILLNTCPASCTMPSFGPKTDFQVGFGPEFVAIGDFNNDGKLDLVTANFGSDNVSILLNTCPASCTTPSFGPKTDFGVGSGPRSVAVGDFNNDGKLDLATANFNSANVSILLNTCPAACTTPSFGQQSDFGLGSGPFTVPVVAVGDFNNDGKLDLAVANLRIFLDSVSILLGTGTGDFGQQSDFGVGSGPFSVAVGDFNNDGKLDLVTANFGSDNISVLLNNFGGTPALPSISGRMATSSGGALSGATVNLSGMQSATTTTDSFGNYSFTNLKISGNYTVTPSRANYTFTLSSQTFNNLVGNQTANFTGTLNNYTISGRVTQPLNNDGVVQLRPGVTITLSVSQIATAITDATGDYSFTVPAEGNYTVTPSLAGYEFTPPSRTFINLSANQTANFSARSLLGPASNFNVGRQPSSVAVGDLNNDGEPDLAVVNELSNSVSILLGTGTANFGQKTDFSVIGRSPVSVALGDFNNDGKLDLATADSQTNNVSSLLNTCPASCATPTFDPTNNSGVGSRPSSVAVGDFNGDGTLDLAVANGGFNTVSILLGTGTGSFGPKTDFIVGSSPESVALGDFNNDGKLDLATTRIFSDRVAILLGTGTGGFGQKTDFIVGSRPSSVAVGDLNGDGKLDLATANVNSDNVSILLGTGTGSFGQKTDFAAGTNPQFVAIGDFNNDGKLDLVTSNTNSANVSILLGTGTGSFGPKTDYGVASGPISVALGDFNLDGKPDVATANLGPTPGNVSILLNNFGGPPALPSISGRVITSSGGALSGASVSLSGTHSATTTTDSFGNYSFSNLKMSGNYTVTPTFLPGASFNPPRRSLVNLVINQTARFTRAGAIIIGFTGNQIDQSSWNTGTNFLPGSAPGSSQTSVEQQAIGANQSAASSLVTVEQKNDQLHITPAANAAGFNYNGLVTAETFDLTTLVATVELVQPAANGADTVFAVGRDSANWLAFVVSDAQGGTPSTASAKSSATRNSSDAGAAGDALRLYFESTVGGAKSSVNIPYDAQQHRFLRFRHDAGQDAVVLETSSDRATWTARHAAPRSFEIMSLKAELGAGTDRPISQPGVAIFDNFELSTSTLQLSTLGLSMRENDGVFRLTVTRTGDLTIQASVDYSTSDIGGAHDCKASGDFASARCDYLTSLGTLRFAAGESSKTIIVPIVDDAYTEKSETLAVRLSGAAGAVLDVQAATLTILDNDETAAWENPIDESLFFVRQHYLDFLGREPDSGGWEYWSDQLRQCGSDQACLHRRRIAVSDAFFYEAEYQRTGAYVYRLYRTAFGNDQPFPNPDQSNVSEARKLPSYTAFVQGRARVIGGRGLAQMQLDLANAFVQRPEFLREYPASSSGPEFIDALLARIKRDIGADLIVQRSALVDLFNQAGRGAVLYHLADDNPTNPISNRALIDREYNRSFVFTQYAGYLRRDADIGGFLFWLEKVNEFPLRNADIQHAMVCAFITSREYQERFASIVTRTNEQCGR